MREPLIEEAILRLKAESIPRFRGRPVVAVETIALDVRRFSVLARVRLRLEDSSQALVVKVPRFSPHAPAHKAQKLKEHLRREYDVPRALGEIGDGLAPGLKVVAPVAFFDDLPALVMEESPGEPLGAVVARCARWYPSARVLDEVAGQCARVGRWLRRFQALTVGPSERFSLESMWPYIDFRLERLARLGVRGVDRHWRAGLRRHFETWAERVGEGERSVCGVHGDFSLSNVLSSAHETVVLDFSRYQTGSPFHDATRFYHQLGLLLHKPAYRPAVVERLRLAFLDGWGDRWTSTTPLFRLYLIQHHVCHWLGLVKEGGHRLPERLFDRWVCARERRALRRLVSTGT